MNTMSSVDFEAIMQKIAKELGAKSDTSHKHWAHYTTFQTAEYQIHAMYTKGQKVEFSVGTQNSVMNEIIKSQLTHTTTTSSLTKDISKLTQDIQRRILPAALGYQSIVNQENEEKNKVIDKQVDIANEMLSNGLVPFTVHGCDKIPQDTINSEIKWRNRVMNGVRFARSSAPERSPFINLEINLTKKCQGIEYNLNVEELPLTLLWKLNELYKNKAALSFKIHSTLGIKTETFISVSDRNLDVHSEIIKRLI